ncbi:site-specific integrase [Candidatus Falkowbacteria bacterium CG10_big_fil_rev_8_21_14_0_10_37_14]|uniref:Site-specific integrase n=2 Tax=Bacteria candidate phyla TaxID=1783234 RepID=A0A2M6WTG8_9BACT|nr:site-specific integrase [Candidatus Falkowbacteria bacterium]OIN89317.1 MAG: hypothetical protein AUJ40_02145 [Candidatus Berkelbacteria bacterium CG1_02_42_45]PIT96041.1 MAG: site-specific integrase [Candidatus Falkowbacteria bacterium CG10_big_fil_rev_8_21_14_0_10_37_14]
MAVRKLRKSWRVDFRYKSIRYRKRSPINTREGAKELEIKIRTELAQGTYRISPIVSPKNFNDFAWHWFDVYVKNNNKHSEIIGKESILRSGLVPYFGKLPLSEISCFAIEEYKRTKANLNLSNKTINNHLSVLRKCLNTAQEWELLVNVPKIRLLKVEPQKFDFLTESESRSLLDNSSGYLADMILLALKTGLRFGEIIALDWQDVNLQSRLLTVSKSVSKNVLGSTKSNKTRYIPLTAELCQMLSAKKSKAGYVFLNGAGNRVRQVNSIRSLYRACKRANLRRIGWHCLRHTFASHLAQKGVPIKAIQELLGHSEIKTTMRYAHLGQSELRSAIDLLDDSQNFGQQAVNIFKFAIPNQLAGQFPNLEFTAKTKQKDDA